MATERFVMGLFSDETQAAGSVSAISETPWRVTRVHSPVPSDRISDALKLKKSRMGYFTLTGGILGFLTGVSLAIFTATRWHLIVSGKPVVALIPFFIVGFEFTILFAVFGNIIGMLTQAKLPDWDGDRFLDERCTGEHFGVLAACPEGDVDKLMDFFRSWGAEARAYEH
jgi:hypothetical protein